MAIQQTSGASVEHKLTQRNTPEAIFHRFTLFPKLPPELRCKILKFALPAPKCVHVTSLYPSEEPLRALSCIESAPIGLLVCHEARAEVLKTYRRLASPKSAPVYCDFDRDFICYSYGLFDEQMRPTLEKLDPKSRMKHLVVGQCLVDHRLQWPETAKHIYELRNLQELILISRSHDHNNTQIQADKLARATILRRSQESGAIEDAVLPHWVKRCAVPLFEQLEAFRKKDATWREPIVRWLGE